MAPTWHEIDRLDAAREQIERAALEISSGGSPVIAATLARAAAQYLSDKLKSQGERSTLQDSAVEITAFIGADVDWKRWTDLVNEPANLLKHANCPDEPDRFVASERHISLIILVAIGDYARIAGEPTPAMLDWLMNWRNNPEQARFYELPADHPELLAMKQVAVEAIGKK